MAANGPSPKRQRLSKNLPSDSDPSIPAANSSPFLDSKDDVIKQIFRRIPNKEVPKKLGKMNLELVCHKFRTVLRDRTCWESDGNLNLCIADLLYHINGTSFNQKQTPKALGILLDRMTVKNIIFKQVGEKVNESLIWNIASQMRAHINSFHLKTITFEDQCKPEGTAVLINVLVGSDLTKVTSITSKILSKQPLVFCCAFWTLVDGCRKSLKVFRWCGLQPQYCYYSKVLTGCPLLSSITLPNLTTEFVAIPDSTRAHLAAVCNSLNQLSYLDINIGNHFQFVSLLNDKIKSRIREYTVYIPLANSDSNSNINFLKSACDYFPNLQRLRCCGSCNKVNASIYLAIVKNIFASFGNRGQYKFTLELPVVDRATRFDILAQIGNRLSAKVSIHNYVYSCLNNELTVVLKF